MSAFSPTGGLDTGAHTVQLGTFWPPLSTAALRRDTGIGGTVSEDRLLSALRASAIEIAAGADTWRAATGAATLAEVPADTVDGESVKLVLWRTAVYAHVRARLFDEVRDLDATRSDHLRSDTLEGSADAWARRATEAVARLTGRPRTIVELI